MCFPLLEDTWSWIKREKLVLSTPGLQTLQPIPLPCLLIVHKHLGVARPWRRQNGSCPEKVVGLLSGFLANSNQVQQRRAQSTSGTTCRDPIQFVPPMFHLQTRKPNNKLSNSCFVEIQAPQFLFLLDLQTVAVKSRCSIQGERMNCHLIN